MIEGAQIANILFDPSYDWIKETAEGTEALEKALRKAIEFSLRRPTAKIATRCRGLTRPRRHG
jgi:hypothetical protein